MIKIAVILPVYNEAKCIAQTFDRILEFSQKNHAYNFIIVNDGSTDNTLQILENQLKNFPTHHIKLISYSHRQGKGYAVKKGSECVDADCICFMDGDLAYSLEHLELLVKKLKEFDVVIGCRNLERENFRNLTLLRKISGKIFNFISGKILDLPYRDMQAGLKGFNKIPAREIFKNQTLTGFCFDAELLFLAKKKDIQLVKFQPNFASNTYTKIPKSIYSKIP
ncbi:glycosyltransferase [Microcoleus sp. F4-D5]|uniref:glycosyltransferase n=1 Tax=Microcoleus sp. F4-D5 TaxID=2818760 RepID=UPI002FD75AF5